MTARRTRLKTKAGKPRATRLQKMMATTPVVEKIWVERKIDESPDLSWLDTKTEGHRIVSSMRYTNADVIKYGWAKVKKWIDEDHKRLAEYGDTWVMTGVVAKARILIPQKTIPISYTMQEVQSGGIWGVESDSDDNYFEELKSEQLDELEHNLNVLGMKDSILQNRIVKATKEDFEKDEI